MISDLAAGSSSAFFPAEPATVGRARRFVVDVLCGWHLDALVDIAALLLSELATNALLHAGTDISVGVSRSGATVRVDVRDGSAHPPARRQYDDAALTGRGLALVDALASRWGVEADPEGKTVWFELDAGTDSVPAGAGAATGPRGEGVGELGSPILGAAMGPAVDVVPVVVRFSRLPTALSWVTFQYGDALCRDVALLGFGGDEPPRDPARWRSPQLDVTLLLAVIKDAIDAGVDTLDVDVPFPPSSRDDALWRLAMVDEADRLAHEDQLLVPPALPELAACRRWLLGEIVRQFEGSPPSPWQLTGQESVSGPRRTLTDDERSELDGLTVAVIAADDSNHIVYVNDDAARLLGWEPSELAGRRLTEIVPPEMREAHLAGFTHHLLTGERRLLGSPVRVPALCRDGSRTDVELVIERFGDRDRHLFVARLLAG